MKTRKQPTLAEAKTYVRSRGLHVRWLPGTTTYEILTANKRSQGLRSFDDIIQWAQLKYDPYRYFDIPKRKW